MKHGKPLHLAPPASGPRPQHGLSLIELLVAMGLGLILVVGIGTVYLGSRQTYRMQEANARVQETGRFALEVIGRSLRQAGAGANISGAQNIKVIECAPPICTAITGANDGTVIVVNGNNRPTDTFTVQFYAGLDELLDMNNDGDFTDANVDCYGSRDATGRRVCGCMIQLAAPCIVANNVVGNQFILQQSAAADPPELAAVGTVNGGGAVTATLLSEVEDFQIQYGVDSDGNQSADVYMADPGAAAQWANVVTAKVCVMVRSVEQGLAAVTQRPLDCLHALDTELALAGTPIPQSGDTRLHRAFVATFNLRNRITNTP